MGALETVVYPLPNVGVLATALVTWPNMIIQGTVKGNSQGEQNLQQPQVKLSHFTGSGCKIEMEPEPCEKSAFVIYQSFAQVFPHTIRLMQCPRHIPVLMESCSMKTLIHFDIEELQYLKASGLPS